MKKNIFILLSIFALALSACSAATNTPTGIADASTLPTQAQLLLGTFKLEGTILAVTPSQAAELLPLWQVYSELSASDTAAQAEIGALVQQIHDTMTEDQLLAIQDMQFTDADMSTVMQENGVGMGVVSQGSSSSSSSSNSSGGMPGGDGAPPMGGDMGAGGGMPVGDPEMSGQAVAQTSTSSQPVSMSAGQVPSMLIEALIQLLETRIAA